MNLPADSRARQQALDTADSFAVAAPAGSGKTGLLTQRVLKLLSQVNYPEEILCLTFTRKAAGEMRQRIIAALHSAADSAPDGLPDFARQTRELALTALERDHARGWQLLKSPNRLRLQTIDSFCRNLSAQLSQESGLGDSLEPVEIATGLYIEAIRDSLLSDMEQQGEVGEAIECLLQHLDNDLDKLERLLIDLLQNRDQWLVHLLDSGNTRQRLEAFLNQLIENTLEQAAELLRPVASDLAMLADYAASKLLANNSDSPITRCLGLTGLPSGDEAGLPLWRALAGLLLTKDADWRKERGVNVNIGFPTARDDPQLGDIRKGEFKALLNWCREQPRLKDILEDVHHLPDAHYEDRQWQVLEALTTLLPRIAARLSLVFQAHGRCDFTEIASAALQALGDDDHPTDLAMKLDYRLGHILIDEFQDTSSLQFELLRRLTRGWAPGDGHSFFAVGDGMQSLYGFRNANVGLFLQARESGIDDTRLAPLELTVNFRSRQGIINWVNQVFQDVFPASHNINRGAVSYNPATAFYPESGDGISLDMFTDYPDAASGQQAEAEQVATLVEQSRQRDPQDTIAILVRNRSHLEAITSSLNRAGHAWQARDIEPLGHQMAVIDLLSLTRALCFPTDRIAWLAILRAPWCGLDLKDLYYLANARETEENPICERFPLLLSRLARRREIAGISPAGQQLLERVAPLLLKAWEQRFRKPLRITIEGLWVALGGNSAIKNTLDLRNCEDFLNLIEQHEVAGQIPDWPNFNLAVERLYAAPKPTNPDDQPLPVQVMTIHKAKGLEFDTVILPGLDRRSGSDKGDLLLWREGVAANGKPQLFIGPITEAGVDQELLYNYLKRERSLKNRLENVRVLYVAATRAVKRLHLTFCRTEGKSPATGTLLSCIWPWLKERLEKRPHATQPGMLVREYRSGTDGSDEATDSQPTAGSTLERLPPDWQPPTHTPAAITRGRPDAPASHPATIHPATDGLQQRAAGTVLHSILENAVKRGLLSPGAAAMDIASLQPFWRQRLRQLGVADTEPAIGKLTQALENILQDGGNLWLFDQQLEDSAAELALGYRDSNGRIRTSVIDRTFVHQGQRWIVDYKLSEPEENQSISSFLAIQRERYQPQLEHYGQFFRDKEPNPVVLALYFPLLPRLEILE